MTIDKFFKKYPEVKGSSKHYAKAMLLAGATEKEVLRVVEPIAKVKASVINMTCPLCSSVMKKINLRKNRHALYCQNDRVTLPFPVK